MNPIALIEVQAATRRTLEGAVPDRAVERHQRRALSHDARWWLTRLTAWRARSPATLARPSVAEPAGRTR